MLYIFKVKIIISDIKGFRKKLKKYFYVNFSIILYIFVFIQIFLKDYSFFDIDSDYLRMYCFFRFCFYINVGI